MSLASATFETASYQDASYASIVIGTCMLNTLEDFGTVMSCNLVRVADTRDVKDCRNRLRAFLFENAGFELDFECLFDAGVTAPEMGEIITFPLVAVKGIILPGTTIKWTSGGERMLSIKAKSWDHLSVSGLLWPYNPVTHVFTNPD